MVQCCDHEPPTFARPVLWAALAINAAMFLTEMVAGAIAGSVSLHADALDFLGDSFNYAISLAVIGLALTWRARAALLKGATMALLGVWVLGEAVWHVIVGRGPEPFIMGGIGTLALAANGLVLSLAAGTSSIHLGSLNELVRQLSKERLENEHLEWDSERQVRPNQTRNAIDGANAAQQHKDRHDRDVDRDGQTKEDREHDHSPET